MTTLTDLIKSAERKIADPTTTPQTVERERAFIHYLTSMQAEIEIKDEALAELRAENAELYAHICESGDMARERSRKRDNVTISGNWDELLRHKWPEEKPTYDPEKKNDYLLWCGEFEQANYHPDGYFHNFVGGCAYEFGDEVVYWWNLPEVTE